MDVKLLLVFFVCCRRKEEEARDLAQKNKRFALVESDPEDDLNIKPKKKKKKKKKEKDKDKSESEDEFDRMENERWNLYYIILLHYISAKTIIYN